MNRAVTGGELLCCQCGRRFSQGPSYTSWELQEWRPETWLGRATREDSGVGSPRIRAIEFKPKRVIYGR